MPLSDAGNPDRPGRGARRRRARSLEPPERLLAVAGQRPAAREVVGDVRAVAAIVPDEALGNRCGLLVQRGPVQLQGEDLDGARPVRIVGREEARDQVVQDPGAGRALRKERVGRPLVLLDQA